MIIMHLYFRQRYIYIYIYRTAEREKKCQNSRREKNGMLKIKLKIKSVNFDTKSMFTNTTVTRKDVKTSLTFDFNFFI